MAKTFQTFWILWQPEHHAPPRAMFTTRADAVRAAERMTHQHKTRFFVMKSDGLCQPSVPPIEWLSPTKEK